MDNPSFDGIDTSSSRRSRRSAVALLLAASSITSVNAQNCISLSGSKACPAFNASSISTNSNLVGLFPFLSSVTNTANFDSGIQNYISNGFTQTQYSTLLGCSNVKNNNATEFYARYTTSVLCNAIIQNSINACGLSGTATKPLCADSCAQYAESEERITASNICGTTNNNTLTQIRADFTNCALPASALTGQCVAAVQNEPDNCGYANNLGSLCSYCASSSPNATDSCCVFSNTTSRCQGVSLPVVAYSSLAPVTTTLSASPSESSAAESSSAAAAAANVSHGLTGGQIAGIVVGAVVGAILILALIIVGCIFFGKRRDSSPATSIFNQPATMEEAPQPSTGYTEGTRDHERAGLAVPFGARVARMSALESSSDSNGIGGGYRKSTSSESDVPRSRGTTGLAPPTTAKRSGSLSSGSRLGAGMSDTSPSSGNEAYTSPDSHGQSEQLAFFKDYYSQDEIHSGDLVSALWAYDPRAADEFNLERGDMIKVIGIWDDGWATGVRVRQRAEDWRPTEKVQRDSGMSNGSSRPPDTSEGEGEVKAFPLVCVCLPQHWRKTIDSEIAEGAGEY